MSAQMERFVRQLWLDDTGQDLIEYALMAALVATGSMILMPMTVNTGFIQIMSRVTSCLERFGNGGG